MKERILPEKFHILSGSVLKMIAVATMLIDHVGVLLHADHILLFTAFGKKITLYWAMRLIGRISFPIFAFLIVEGYEHTRSRVRYGASLLVCAVLSEIPYDLFRFGMWFAIGKQNVFLTLFLGYVGICVYEKLKGRLFLQACVTGALLILAWVLRADYGMVGFCTIMLMYALRDHELLRDIVGVATLSSGWKATFAFIPLAFYNGKRGFIKGQVLKYAFYLFYPLHLLILYFIKMRYLG